MTTENYTDTELFALLDEMQHEADKAQEKAQYGKAGHTMKYLHWVDNKPIEVEFSAWKALGKKERGMKICFTVDIQEFNPSLDFTYSREVSFGSTDWFKITWPSLQEVTSEKELSKALAKLTGSYVEASDVLQAPTKKNPNPEYRTVKFVKLYASREECHAAWAERFGKNGETPAATPTIEIPESSIWNASNWPGIYEGFKKACDEANTKSDAAVRKAMAENIATDYSVPDTYVAKFVIPF